MNNDGWRTLILNSKSKLSYSNNSLVISHDDITDIVPLEQLRVIIINSLETQISSKLICVFNEYNIKLIFCDPKKTPCCEIVGYNNNFYSAGRIEEQFNWSEDIKNLIWQKIVRKKITSQSRMLNLISNENFKKLEQMVILVEFGDITNREAVAAKIYFHSLFGMNFIRHTENNINSALNYGYSILLSSFNRSLTLHGYYIGKGVHHKSKTNPYNLSCDIMEPFRPFIDYYVYKNKDRELDWNYKLELISLCELPVIYGGKCMELQLAIECWVTDVVAELDGCKDRMKEINFYEKL